MLNLWIPSQAGKAVYGGAEIAENKERNERSDADSEVSFLVEIFITAVDR